MTVVALRAIFCNVACLQITFDFHRVALGRVAVTAAAWQLQVNDLADLEREFRRTRRRHRLIINRYLRKRPRLPTAEALRWKSHPPRGTREH